ncbi:hypothetical protein E1269_15205 [Jiangella asiatica]|uniref:Uncharacterized protein n=1 Tax=Jiangella asiatica TaxID=2530372 RepID=A0A4R5D6S3_9ACTN|nr:hypothetical protein E1269_15205 [Jiangella asiatica]
MVPALRRHRRADRGGTRGRAGGRGRRPDRRRRPERRRRRRAGRPGRGAGQRHDAGRRHHRDRLVRHPTLKTAHNLRLIQDQRGGRTGSRRGRAPLTSRKRRRYSRASPGIYTY